MEIWITGEEGGGVLSTLETEESSQFSQFLFIQDFHCVQQSARVPGDGLSPTYSCWELSSRVSKPLKASIVSNLLVICFFLFWPQYRYINVVVLYLQAKQYWPHYKRLLLKCSMFQRRLITLHSGSASLHQIDLTWPTCLISSSLSLFFFYQN